MQSQRGDPPRRPSWHLSGVDRPVPARHAPPRQRQTGGRRRGRTAGSGPGARRVGFCAMTADAGRVRLVILNYNGGPFVLRSLAHASRLEWPGEVELVVVDNASTDGSVESIAAEFPDVRIIHNATNTGFPANNLALRDLDGLRYVGLINNDGFVEPGWLTALATALDDD